MQAEAPVKTAEEERKAAEKVFLAELSKFPQFRDFTSSPGGDLRLIDPYQLRYEVAAEVELPFPINNPEQFRFEMAAAYFSFSEQNPIGEVIDGILAMNKGFHVPGLPAIEWALAKRFNGLVAGKTILFPGTLIPWEGIACVPAVQIPEGKVEPERRLIPLRDSWRSEFRIILTL